MNTDGTLVTLESLRTALALDDFDGLSAQRILEPATRGRPPDGSAGRPPRKALK